MKVSRLVVLLMLLVFSNPCVAEICKWVDEGGVTYYAETCPEDVESTEVETYASPSQEQVDAAFERSEQALEARKVQNEIETPAEQSIWRPRLSKAEIKQGKKDRQQEQCAFWETELADMVRHRSFRSEQLDLKELIRDNCAKKK